MKNKRGQFYLISAIIIITVLVGFSVISNYARNKEIIKLYDLKEELGIESAYVLDYGIYQESTNIEDLLLQFIEDYADYAGEGRNLYFVFGNSDKITAIAYKDLTTQEEVSVKVKEQGGVIEKELKSGEKVYFYPSISTTTISIIIDNHEYRFSLKEGQNFYFVISQEVAGDKYVTTG